MHKQWLQTSFVLALCICLTLGLAGCQPDSSQNTLSAPVKSRIPSTEAVHQVLGTSPDAQPAVWQVEENILTDEYLISLVISMEAGLVGDNSFTFSAPEELSESELYLCFLLLSDHDELLANYWEDDEAFVFTSDVIVAQLSKYFKNFHFDITQDYNYNAEMEAIVTPQASGFGGNRYIKVADKILEGNTVSFTANFYNDYEMQTKPYEVKTYGIEFYEGGWYYLYANRTSNDSLSYYLEVLQNQREVIIRLEGKYSDINTYLASHRGQTFDSFAICDLDLDGAPEIILNKANHGYAYYYRLILHEQDGVVYGYELPYRGFKELKTDGTFSNSTGVSDNGTAAITFDKENYTIDDITYCCSGTDPQTGQMKVSYFVDHEEATMDQFLMAMDQEGEKPNVLWYDYTDENIEKLLST